jgi:hypothetical protein
MNATASRSLAACALALLAGATPAAARDFVVDQAGMFSAGAVAQLDQRIASFNAQTGKEIVVVTTPSLGGATLQSAASSAFAAQNVNGVLIFIARDDRKDTTGAIDAILNIYRAHLGGLQRSAGAGAAPAQRVSSSPGGFGISMFWWIIIAVVGFLLLRSILRAFAAPRYYGGPPGAAPPPGASSGPGYSPGYGYGGFGGGGSFWSGLLGGLGGAWLGNELFRGGGIAPVQGAQMTPDAGGGFGGADSAGWQSDAGQADMGGASGGDWSGGGFGGDAGGGGGDFGGGDSGGGW